MSEVVLWRRAEPVLKGDGEVTFTKAELDRLCAEGEADPEIQELVRECLADPGSPSPAVGKVVERVKVRKGTGMGAGAEAFDRALAEIRGTAAPVRKQAAAQPTAAELRERVAKLDEQIAVTKAQIATTKANAAAADAYDLCVKGCNGDREAFEKGRAMLHDPVVYEAYQALTAGVPFAVPVEKKAPDHRAQIRKLAAEGDFDGLDAVVRGGRDAAEQYRELQLNGELRWPADALAKADASNMKRKLLELHAKLDGSPEAARAFARLQRTPEGQKAWQALVAEGKVKVAA